MSTWSGPGNDVSLWPRGWNQPRLRSDGEGNPYSVPVELRAYYRRTAEHDREIVDAWPIEQVQMPRDPVHVGGLPLLVCRAEFVGFGRDKQPRYSPTREQHMLHYVALIEAQQRKATAEHDAREAQADVTVRRCECCGVTGDTSVAARAMWAARSRPVRNGPRFSTSCARLAAMMIADEFARRARELAIERTPDGETRGVAVKRLLDQSWQEILP